MFDPLGVVEGDCGDDAPTAAVDSGKTAFLHGTLGENNLVAERTDAHSLDVDPELAGPETGQREVWPTIGLETDHVVRCDPRSEDCVVPVLQRQELVLVQHVGKARDVTDDEDGIGHHTVDVEGATPSVAIDAPVKVMFAAEFFHLADNMKEKPLIYPIVFKSTVFSMVLIVCHIIEEVVVGMLRVKRSLIAFRKLVGEVWKEY
jgi:hypothetical protein